MFSGQAIGQGNASSVQHPKRPEVMTTKNIVGMTWTAADKSLVVLQFAMEDDQS